MADNSVSDCSFTNHLFKMDTKNCFNEIKISASMQLSRGPEIKIYSFIKKDHQYKSTV